MTKLVSVTIPLSGGRSVRFTTAGAAGVQVVAQGGHVSPGELAGIRQAALQRLADETETAVRDGGDTYTPRLDPSAQGRKFKTR